MRKALEAMVARLEKLADTNELCQDYWIKLLDLQSRYLNGEHDAADKIWDFLKDNVAWVFGKKQISWEDMTTWFTEEELAKHDIYVNQEGVKINNGFAILYNSSGYFTGHSRIYLFGKSNGRAFDQCFVSIYDTGMLSAKDCLVYAFDQASVTMNGYGKVEAWDRTNVSGSGYSYLIMAEDSFEVHKEGVVVRRR